MHKILCQKYTGHNLAGRLLFEIGVVGEDVDEILNHSVAEVVLLLEEEAEREGEGVNCAFKKCPQFSLSFFFFISLFAAAADLIFSRFPPTTV